ncbi:MAG: aldose epimerase family protein, partial [Marivita sp.]|uniref:aldose epimerase family protein n=1 Tax=Marivita sp. TaxID=2003365 RepID=UPI003EF9CC3E
MKPRHYGILPDGREVKRITLQNDRLRVSILTFGAILEDVRLDGVEHGLCLGMSSLEAYLADSSFNGGIVGPVANRIRDAAATIAGAPHRFTVNEPPSTTLHGGAAGIHRYLWDLVESDAGSALLRLNLAHGDGGFPGNRVLTARFSLDAASLSLTLGATSDRETIINLTNHSYWRMGPGPTVAGHRLTVAADTVTQVDKAKLPTGEFDPAQFRNGVVLNGNASDALDTNFCLIPGAEPAAILEGPSAKLSLSTDQPGLQVYDGVGISHAGVALEAQRFPDAPNLWP